MASAIFYKGKLYGDEIPVEQTYDPDSANPISGQGVAEALETVQSEVTDVKQNGTSVVVDGVANVTVPTKTSDLTNDSDFITSNDITGKEDKSNKVTSISSSSTDTEYPSAKAVYDFHSDNKDVAFVEAYHSSFSDVKALIDSGKVVYAYRTLSGTKTFYRQHTVTDSQIEFLGSFSFKSEQSGDSWSYYTLRLREDGWIGPQLATADMADGKSLWQNVYINDSTTTYDGYIPYVKHIKNYAENKSNKVTSISSSSTDTQYPSAKAVYDAINAAVNDAIDGSY